MRAEAFTIAEWTAEIGETDAGRGIGAPIVTFVDRRGRTARVALGHRVRRFAGLEDGRNAAPACDVGYRVMTIH